MRKLYYIFYNILINPLLTYMWLRKKKFNFKGNNLKIHSFKNKYQGKTCLIVGSASSLDLEEFTDFIKKNEVIVFSFNSVTLNFKRINFSPDYYSIIDPKIFNDLMSHAVSNFDQKTTFLLSNSMKFINDRSILFKISYFNHFIEFMGIILLRKHLFSQKIEKVIFDGYSVLYFTLQIVLFMGFSKIHLMGIDLNYQQNGKYAIDYKGSPTPDQNAVMNMRIYFELFLKRAKKIGINVINSSSKSPLKL